MGRIRTIKPEAFLHEGLYELERDTGLPIRWAFAGLWCHADREGRFEWRPKRLKAQILPYDKCDFSRVLDALTTRGFLVRYSLSTRAPRVPHACPTRDDASTDPEADLEYGWIPTFTKHQVVNNREAPSALPDPFGSDCNVTTSTRGARVPHACPTPLNLDQVEGKGTGREQEGKGKEQEDGAETGKPSAAAPSATDPVVVIFPCDGATRSWSLTQSQIDVWQRDYPALDVTQQCRQARNWIDADAKRRKTAAGMKRFLVGWLNRSQDSGTRTHGGTTHGRHAPGPGQRHPADATAAEGTF